MELTIIAEWDEEFNQTWGFKYLRANGQCLGGVSKREGGTYRACDANAAPIIEPREGIWSPERERVFSTEIEAKQAVIDTLQGKANEQT